MTVSSSDVSYITQEVDLVRSVAALRKVKQVWEVTTLRKVDQVL